MGNLISLSVQLPDLPSEMQSASNMIVVEDNDTYEYAVGFVAEVKKNWKTYDEKRSELKAGALKTCRDIDAFFKPVLTFFENEEKAVKSKISAYLTAKRIEDERRQAEAEKAAEAERVALAKQAAAAEKKGNAEEAEALRQTAALVSAPVVNSVNKVDGAHTRKDWKVEVTDVKAFLKAALKDDALLAMVEIKDGALKKYVAATGKAPAGVAARQIDVPVITTF